MPNLLSSPAPLRRLAMPILATLLLTGASAIALAGDLSFAETPEPSDVPSKAAATPGPLAE